MSKHGHEKAKATSGASVDRVPDQDVEEDRETVLDRSLHSLDRTLSQPTGHSGDKGGAAPAAGTVSVTVAWRGVFGADLSARVVLLGRNGSGKWNELAVREVQDADKEQGGSEQKEKVMFAVSKFAEYKAVVTPIAKDTQAVDRLAAATSKQKRKRSAAQTKEDEAKLYRYRSTTFEASLGKSSGAVRLGGLLTPERWNESNVEQRFEDKKLDVAKAKQVGSYPLFGQTVQVHELLQERVAQTNALFEAKPPERQQEIKDSLFVVGGYAYRTQAGKAANFTNHSVGMAIDINYNEGDMQNALMEDDNELALLNILVEPVVKTVPGMESFDVWKSVGQAQLQASQAFSDRFPGYLAELLSMTGALGMSEGLSKTLPMSESAIRDAAVHHLFNSITPADFDTAIAALKNSKEAKDATRLLQLKLIQKNWNHLSAWVLGAAVTDRQTKSTKTAKGMIPLHSDVLQIMKDGGWSWGGDWTGKERKDYMHFEDERLLQELGAEEHTHEKKK